MSSTSKSAGGTGLQLYREIVMQDHPEPTSPRSATLMDFIFAEIWSRPGLSRRERRLITLTCLGGADAHETLAAHFYGSLKSGELTLQELDEFVLHFAVYCRGSSSLSDASRGRRWTPTRQQLEEAAALFQRASHRLWADTASDN
jgi:4-carboxymuconolactone decarboxylase